jgi:uncharacterized protein (TIGR02001 family)
MRHPAASLNLRVNAALVVAAGLLCLDGVASFPAHAQTQQQYPINLGGRGWGAAEAARTTPIPDRAPEAIQFSVKAGMASDYIYRGVTLSDRSPAVGAGIEATYRWLYAGATVASVKLPTQPSAEITVSGGVRPTLGPVEFDLGITYFAYPGETPGGPTNGIEYWEAAFRAVAPVGESIRVAAGYAYSPDVSNTGAWSQYAAAGFGFEIPARLLPRDIGVSFTTAAGYSWFGRQVLALGGFELPAYLNWQAGVTFSHKFLNLDLRYYDTNLSKENCFVFTGDPNAAPGGRINPITNPDGLMSGWCSATVVAKLWFELN